MDEEHLADLDAAFACIEQEEKSLPRPHWECWWEIDLAIGEIIHHCRIEGRSFPVGKGLDTPREG